jgi:hypothetical protein
VCERVGIIGKFFVKGWGVGTHFSDGERIEMVKNYVWVFLPFFTCRTEKRSFFIFFAFLAGLQRFSPFFGHFR